MAFFKVLTLQLALGAAAWSCSAMASAQMNRAQPAAEAATMDAAQPAMKKHHHHHHHHHHKAQQPMHDRDVSAREAAAARADAKKGRLDDGLSASQYEHNAYARCGVFKTEMDQQACMARIKGGAVSGSVKEGGILREATVEEIVR